MAARAPTPSGYVIQAFGKLIMGGNFVIGLIVFAILVIVNFVVITKGSGRIAEVAARFTLDAMPGKQMAIDADLSAGLIDEKEARDRRKTLEAETNFFGAMDGASKFVRGDAIAGLMIVAINVIGGIIIGVAQKGMSFADASQTFTLLTVGDGLVSQMPALIVSTAAGLMVSKAGVEGSTDKALIGQLSVYPQALGMAAAVMGIVALLPGMPTLAFAGLVRRHRLRSPGSPTRSKDAAEAQDARRRSQERTADAAPKEEPISTALALDLLRVELGYGLLPLINDVKGHRITDQIKALRRQLAQRDGLRHAGGAHPRQHAAGRQRVPHPRQGSGCGPRRSLSPAAAGHGSRRACRSTCPARTRPSRPSACPRPGSTRRCATRPSFRGLTVVDPGTVLTTHLTEVLKAHMSRAALLCRDQEAARRSAAGEQEAGRRTDPVRRSRSPACSACCRRCSASASRSATCRRSSKASPKPSATPRTRCYITEHVRAPAGAPALRRQSRAAAATCRSSRCRRPGSRPSPSRIVGQGEDRQLAMAPSQLQQFIQTVRDRFDDASSKGEVPVLLTSPQIRPFVRSIVERFRPADGGDVAERNPPDGPPAHDGAGVVRDAPHASTSSA